MRKLVTIVAAVALAAALQPAAQAARSTLKLVGSRSASIEIELGRTTFVSPAAARMTYAGEHAGWFLKRVGSTDRVIGSYAIRDAVPTTGSSSEPTSSTGYGRVELEPGLYRLFLVADGPTEITVPVRGMRSMTLEPTSQISAASGVKDFTIGQGGVVNEELRTPTRVTANSFAVSMVTLYSDVGMSGLQMDACYVPSGSPCEPPSRISGVVVSGDEGTWFSYIATYQPGELTPGELDAVQSLKAAGTTTEGTGAWMVVNLGD